MGAPAYPFFERSGTYTCADNKRERSKSKVRTSKLLMDYVCVTKLHVAKAKLPRRDSVSCGKQDLNKYGFVETWNRYEHQHIIGSSLFLILKLLLITITKFVFGNRS
ncbi:hypothetical protein YC2023_111346 [Brassica napus]